MSFKKPKFKQSSPNVNSPPDAVKKLRKLNWKPLLPPFDPYKHMELSSVEI